MDYKEIEKMAAEHFRATGGLIPVPVVEVANKLGLAVYETEMPQTDGRVPSGVLRQTDEGKWTVILNAKEAYSRKRFTLAHEVGHFLIHKGRPFIDTFDAGETFYRNGSGDGEMEKEANYFAANLLMPEASVREIWPVSISPADAAGKFDVSEVSMTYRLKFLGLIETG